MGTRDLLKEEKMNLSTYFGNGNSVAAPVIRHRFAGLLSLAMVSALAVLTAVMAGNAQAQEPSNFAPVFVTDDKQKIPSVVREVKENLPSGSPVGAPVVATDQDNDTITYSIRPIHQHDQFTVDASTGQIRTRNSMDHEDGVGVRWVSLRAEDPSGAAGHVIVIIKVANANDPPEFSASEFKRYVGDGLPKDTPVGAPVTATDLEGDTVTYTMDDGTRPYRKPHGISLYYINGSTGQIYTSAGPTQVSQGGDPYNTSHVTATDSKGNSTTVKVFTRVIANNNVPVPKQYEHGRFLVRVTEHVAVGSNLGDPVSATDRDADPLVYSMRVMDTRLQTAAQLDFVGINPSTGQLFVKRRPDFETLGRLNGHGNPMPRIGVRSAHFHIYLAYIVTADDGRGGRAETKVFIEVKNIRGGAEFTREIMRRSVPETATANHVEVEQRTHSVKGDPVGAPVTAVVTFVPLNKPTYALSGPDANKFSIDAATGQIRLADGKLDYETDDEHVVYVTASLDGQTDRARVFIDVTDVNELVYVKDPRAGKWRSEGGYAVRFPVFVPKGALIGPPMTIVDPDGLEVYYNMYDAVDGFTVDRSTGQISATKHVLGALDPTSDTGIDLYVDGRTGSHDQDFASAKITVLIGVDNQGPVEITESYKAIALTTREDAAVGDPVGNPVSTTDPDGPDDQITYSLEAEDNTAAGLTPGYTAGSKHYDLFSVDSDGQVRVAKPLAFSAITGRPDGSFEMALSPDLVWGKEDELRIPFLVRATDEHGATGLLFTHVIVTYVDRAPVFDRDRYHRSIEENSPVGTVIDGLVAATDPNGENLSYALSGEHAEHLSIDGNGAVSLASVLDHELVPSLSAQVSATDVKGNTVSVPLTVEIIDVNEAPAFAADSVSLDVSVNSEVGTLLGAPLVATDPDEGDNISYSMKGFGNADAYIALDQRTGQLSLKSYLEVLDDVDEYQVEVKAWDTGGLSDTMTVTISETVDLGGGGSIGGGLDMQVTSLLGPAGGTATGPFKIVVDFGEPFTGLETSDFILEGPVSVADLAVPQQLKPGDDATWVVSVTPKSSGTLAFTLPAGAAANAFGDGNVASDRLVVKVDIGTEGYRSVTMQHYGPNLVVAPFELYLTFDQPIRIDTGRARAVTDSPVGFALYLDGLTITNAVVNRVREWNQGGPKAPYTHRHYVLTIAPYNDGVVNIRLESGAFGNVTPAEYTVTADLYRPAVTVKGPEGPVQGDFKVTVAFNKSSTTLAASGLEVVNGTVSEIKPIGDNNDKYHVTIQPTAPGTVSVTVKEGASRMYGYSEHWRDEVNDGQQEGNFRSSTYSVTVAQ